MLGISPIGHGRRLRPWGSSKNLLKILKSFKQIDRIILNQAIHTISIDITNKDSVDEFIANLKSRKIKIDILINNAGYLVSELFGDTTYDSFKKTFDVNVFGLAEITRSLIPIINSDGHVINISSIGGVNGSKKFPGLSAYSSSKAAVIALTEVLAEEYQNGPSFNVLALGAVQTKMLKEAFPDYNVETKPEEMAKYILDFAINGNKLFNGKLISVSNSNP